MKKLLSTFVLAIYSLAMIAQTNWQKGGNTNFSAPPGLPPTIGTDITWNSPLNFVTRGVQRMTILGGLPGGPTTGFVGINTTSPAYQLDVTGEINLTTGVSTPNTGYRINNQVVLQVKNLRNTFVGVNAGAAYTVAVSDGRRR